MNNMVFVIFNYKSDGMQLSLKISKLEKIIEYTKKIFNKISEV